jgi:hypothetical protein
MNTRNLFYFLIIIVFGLFLNSCAKNADGTVTVIPIAPTTLKATTFSTTAINLTWTDNSTNEDGFKIERKNSSSDFSLIATLGADKTAYKDSLLTPYTTYTYRVYTYNTAGKSINYSNLDSATTNGVPLLTTQAIDSLSYTSAKSGGIITNSGGASIISKGIVWSSNNIPSLDLPTKTNEGVDTGNYKSLMTGLMPGTLYNVWAYATNSKGTGFGNMVSFTTLPIALPTISTDSVTAKTSTSAMSGGIITSDGGSAVTARGVCWATTSNPTTANSKTTEGSGIGTFTSSLTGLTAATTYYVRSYATNSVGTVYGTQVNFTTTSHGYDVYVAGHIYIEGLGETPTVWKNGIATSLTNTVNKPYPYDAESVFVVGNDVYVAGSSYNDINLNVNPYLIPTVWKNNVAINLNLTSPLIGGNARSVFVVGADVYVAGTSGTVNSFGFPTVWKNGIASAFMTNLSGTKWAGDAFSIFVVGADVYVAGRTNYVDGKGDNATLWKNGVATNLGQGIAYSVFVVGADVYVVGDIGGYPSHGLVAQVAKVWKNGVATNLTNGVSARSVFVVGADVYVAGTSVINGEYFLTVWKNGVATNLTNIPDGRYANSVFVAGTDVYVVESSMGNYTVPRIWKNGVATNLTSTNITGGTRSIFVKSK